LRIRLKRIHVKLFIGLLNSRCSEGCPKSCPTEAILLKSSNAYTVYDLPYIVYEKIISQSSAFVSNLLYWNEFNKNWLENREFQVIENFQPYYLRLHWKFPNCTNRKLLEVYLKQHSLLVWYRIDPIAPLRFDSGHWSPYLN